MACCSSDSNFLAEVYEAKTLLYFTLNLLDDKPRENILKEKEELKVWWESQRAHQQYIQDCIDKNYDPSPELIEYWRKVRDDDFCIYGKPTTDQEV